MTTDEKREAIMDAIDSSESRCPDYYDSLEPCDGLDGCPFCLRLAATAVLAALEVK